MDEDWRRQEHAPLDEFRARVARVPTPVLAEMHARLTTRERDLAARIATIDACCRKCRCGAISDERCAKCAAEDAKADELLRYWKQHGAFNQWLKGERVLVEDAIKFCTAWLASRNWRKGKPVGGGTCLFPICGAEVIRYWGRVCENHRWCISPVLALGRKDESR